MTQDIVEVPLSQGLVALIDAADAERVLAHKWTARRSVNTFYALRNIYHRGEPRRTVFLHAFLTGYLLTDHRNGNGLDNRRANLREATRTENNRNVGQRSDNTSGFKGVSWNKQRQKWVAYIMIDKRQRFLGHYDNPEDAAHAYDAAAREGFGEFAWVNLPDRRPL